MCLGQEPALSKPKIRAPKPQQVPVTWQEILAGSSSPLLVPSKTIRMFPPCPGLQLFGDEGTSDQIWAWMFFRFLQEKWGSLKLKASTANSLWFWMCHCRQRTETLCIRVSSCICALLWKLTVLPPPDNAIGRAQGLPSPCSCLCWGFSFAHCSQCIYPGWDSSNHLDSRL